MVKELQPRENYHVIAGFKKSQCPLDQWLRFESKKNFCNAHAHYDYLTNFIAANLDREYRYE